MDNQRLILLLVFSFSLIMLWEAWQKQGQPKPGIPAGTTQGATVPATSPVPSPTPTAIPAEAGLPVASASPAVIHVKSVSETVRTDLFNAEISAQGGDLVRLELVQHLATEDKTRKFLLFDNGEKHFYQAQSGLIGENLPNHKSLYQFVAGSRELK